MRRAAKVDATQDVVAAAYRSAGWSVRSTAQLGGGFPDLVVAPPWDADYVFLVEVKTPKSKKERSTKAQDAFAQTFPVKVIRTVEEAHAHMTDAYNQRAA